MNRRRFLGAAAACLAVPQLAIRPRELHARTRLILLGTAAGPRPRATRSAPAQAIVVGDTAYGSFWPGPRGFEHAWTPGVRRRSVG